MKLSDLNILDIGHTIQITGFVLDCNGIDVLVPFPGEQPFLPEEVMELSTDEWAEYIRQSDLLEVGLTFPKKAIVRKSQRQIDAAVSWAVFKRDGYACRYCGRDDVPLTVDHIDLFEAGGVAIQQNLNSCCRKCNRLRGSIPYEEWVISSQYGRVSVNLHPDVRRANLLVVDSLPVLRKMRVSHIRSR